MRVDQVTNLARKGSFVECSGNWKAKRFHKFVDDFVAPCGGAVYREWCLLARPIFTCLRFPRTICSLPLSYPFLQVADFF